MYDNVKYIIYVGRISTFGSFCILNVKKKYGTYFSDVRDINQMCCICDKINVYFTENLHTIWFHTQDIWPTYCTHHNM